MTKLYVVRTAPAVETLEEDLWRSDAPLSEAGRELARDVGRELASRDLRFTALLSSPLMRAASTCSIIGQKCGYADTRVRTYPHFGPGNMEAWDLFATRFSPSFPDPRRIFHADPSLLIIESKRMLSFVDQLLNMSASPHHTEEDNFLFVSDEPLIGGMLMHIDDLVATGPRRDMMQAGEVVILQWSPGLWRIHDYIAAPQ